MSDPRALAEAFHGLIAATLAAADWLKAHGVAVPDDVAADLAALKTEAHYDRVLRRAIRDVYNGKMDEGDLVSRMADLIENQFQRAFNQGLREAGYEPGDAKEEWLIQLYDRQKAEQDHVLDYVQAVIDARVNGAPIDPLLARADMWANRYNEIVDWARHLASNRDDLEEWILGATEQHCRQCFALNGTVATVEEWDESGYQPQNAPNPMIDCGGWNCDCRRLPTKKPKTPGGIPKL